MTRNVDPCAREDGVDITEEKEFRFCEGELTKTREKAICVSLYTGKVRDEVYSGSLVDP